MGRPHPTTTSQAALTANLRALGLVPGMIVLVHSSLSALGWVEGGAEAAIAALIEAVSPGGTLLVPTLTGTAQDDAEHPPSFDPRSTPCWTGIIPETMRRLPGAVRSRHPTHSVAGIGPAMTKLIAGHEYCPTPCAAESPYGRLAEMGGSILLLGVTHRANTSLHMVEELAEVPYHMHDRAVRARVARDDGSWEEIVTHLHSWRWDTDFLKVGPLLGEGGAQREGLVGRAITALVDARAMRDRMAPLLRRNPLLLLTPQARAEYERPPGLLPTACPQVARPGRGSG